LKEGVTARTRSPAGFSAEVEDDLTGGSGLSAGEREEDGYRFRFGFLGRGPDLELGQMVSPGPFYIFFFFSSFFFSVFLFLLELLHYGFKLIQTSF
jgi:hypothetical protein